MPTPHVYDDTHNTTSAIYNTATSVVNILAETCTYIIRDVTSESFGAMNA